VPEARKTHSVDILAVILESQNKYGNRIDFTIPKRGISGRKPMGVRKGSLVHIRELFENAVTYGTAPPGTPLAECRVSLDDGKLIIEVTNESPPINLAPLKNKLIAAARENRVAQEDDGGLWVCNSEAEVADRVKNGLARKAAVPEELDASLRKNPNQLMFVGRLSGHESADRPGGIGLYLLRKMAREGGGDLRFSCKTTPAGHIVTFILILPVFEDT